MSGICGIFFVNGVNHGKLKQRYLAPMLRVLDPSSYDERDTLEFGKVALGAGVFNRRLAGAAHTISAGRNLGVVFHGSIYNKEEFLVNQEYTSSNLFLGLLSLYKKEGIGFINRLRGEFSIALWDGADEVLYLITDPFRVHPIFYYEDPEKIIFATRIKAILASSQCINRTINLEALVDYVAFSAIPTPKTIFRNIKKLPPGHILRYRKGSVNLIPYWEINFISPDSSPENELGEKLRIKLNDAIASRYKSDGGSDEIGAFLSGGIDSSTITGVLTEIAKKPIKTFTVSFQEEKFNEGVFARITSAAYGTKHHNFIVNPKSTFETIPILMENYDEPFGNASAVPTYLCAKNAFNHGVTILYAGDGGDELFAGNERYALQRLFDYYKLIPEWLWDDIFGPCILGLDHFMNCELLEKGKKYIRRAKIPYPQRLSSYSVFEEIKMTEIFGESLLEQIGENYNPYEAINVNYFKAPASTDLDRQLYVDLQLSISDNDLFKVTRMTEAAGVAVRYPFLDKNLAEFAASVPAKLKMRGRNLRSFFKKAYADFLPQEILRKKKHGFGLPIQVWLYQDKRLRDMCLDLILSDSFYERGFFEKKAVMEIAHNSKAYESSIYGTILWNLMILELWFRKHVDS